jgi:O-antigen/teichoic acid export membrane protein
MKLAHSEITTNIKKGFFWNSMSQFASKGISFLSIIILGRLLNPDDFGILSMITIFIAVSDMIVDSGMGGSLFKKTNVTIIDYSTLFIYNLVISLILYVILYFIAPIIADFYNKTILIPLIRVVGLVIIIHALCIVQNIRILKELKFKALTIINCVCGLISLITAIIFAKNGYGVWTLIVQQISFAITMTLLLVIYNKFIPSLAFSIKAFKEQFSFGIYLLSTNFLQTITNNITSNIIAKVASLNQAGYFTQSNRIIGTTNQTLAVIIDRTVFPIFAKIENLTEVKHVNINLSKNVFSILFPLSALLSLLSEPIIIILLGNKWSDMAWILRILSFSLIPLIIQMLCRNILKSRANTKQILFNEIVKSILLIISLIIGIMLGMQYIIWGIVITQTIACLWIMYSISEEIQYSYRHQLSNTLILVSISLLSYFFSNLLFTIIQTDNHFLNIIWGIALMVLFVLIFSYLFGQKEIFNIIRKGIKFITVKIL